MNIGLKRTSGIVCAVGFAALLLPSALAQVLTRDDVEKVAPKSFFFAHQSAATQLRNTAGFKSGDGQLVLAGLVDTSGYSTAIAQKYQGFLITEAKTS